MMPVAEAREALRGAILEFQQRPKMATATLDSRTRTVDASETRAASSPAVVVSYTAAARPRRTRTRVKAMSVDGAARATA
jgi:hypothetical protein